MDNNNFLKSLSKSLIDDVRKIMEAKTHTVPATDKEKKLAALAEPKDKITHADVLKGRGVTREEVEQVDELSTDTMRSYMDKASDARGHRNLSTKKVDNRYAGVRKASSKLAKEEVEVLDEATAKIVAHLQKRYGDNIRKSHVMSAANDFGVGYTGLAHAVRKKLGVIRLKEEIDADLEAELKATRVTKKSMSDAKKTRERANGMKEEVELDEASKPGYFRVSIPNKATKYHNADNAMHARELAQKSYDNPPAEVAARRADTHKGLDFSKASVRRLGDKVNLKSKFSKEEVEQVDEISKATMGRYINKAKDSIDLTSYRSGIKDGTAISSSTPYKSNNPLEKKLTKRHKGIETAVKKLTKEDAEQIDELSKKTLGSYVKKAKDQMSRSDQIAGIELGRRSDAGARVGNLERKHNKRASKRYFGIDKAVDKLTKEEAEQIDELSKKTLGSYVKKASGAERPKNPMNPKSVPITTIAAYQGDSETGHFGKRFNQATYDKAERLRKNRETGIKTAVDKLTKEEIEMIEAKLAGVAPGSMEGDAHMCATKVFHKEWNEGTPIKTMHADPDAEGLIEWYDVMFDHGIERVMTEDMEVLQAESHMHSKKKMKEEVELDEGSYKDNPRHMGTIGPITTDAERRERARKYREKKMKEGYVPTSDEPTASDKKTADKVRAMMAKEKMKEEVEQVDELSVVGLDKYHSKAYQSMFDKDSDKKTVAKRKKGMDMAYNKAGFGKAKVYASEEAEQVVEVSKNLMLKYLSANKKSDKAAQEKGDYSKSDKRMRGTDVAVRKYTASNNKYVRVPATEETKLDEAKRGRPAKNAPVGQDEEPAALGYQLRKATSINKPVHFMNGERKEVSTNHVERFNDHMGARKSSQEKAAFQTRAHKSHAEFVKAVSEPFPKASRDTGEIVRYRH
jgi:hypothetical protein